MDDVTIALLSVVALFSLIIAGVHIGFALILTTFVAMFFITGSFDIASGLLASTAYSGVRDYIFAVAPLFILMGAFMTNSNAAAALYAAAHRLLQRVKGGLAVATVFANTVFAAVTGVSVASAAVFATISYPEMQRHNYSKRLALGAVAGSSILGMLLPPSLLMILYGVLTGVSIGSLFIAGIIPGIILAVMFSVGIVIMATLRPSLVDTGAQTRPEPVEVGTGSGQSTAVVDTVDTPRNLGGDSAATTNLIADEPAAASRTREQDLSTLRVMLSAVPLLALVGLVIGGIWLGFFSPTEAGAVAALGALVLGAFMGMTIPGFIDSFKRAAISTGAIMFLLVAAQMYSRMLATSGLVGEVGQFVSDLVLPDMFIVALFIIILIVMGAVLDSSSIILLSVPFMFPTVTMLGLDPIWFGVIMIVAVEIGLLTPPFGMVPFAMSAVLGKRANVEDIFIGSFPFVVVMLLFLGLLMAFPALTTWLPQLF